MTTTLRFKEGDFVHVGRDLMGNERNTVGHVATVVPDSAHPYGVWLVNPSVYVRASAEEVTDGLASTGFPIRTTLVAATIGATIGVGIFVAPELPEPATPSLSDVTTAPVVTPTPVVPQPYRPEPHTSRQGERKSLTPSPSASVARPSTTPAKRHRVSTPPADVRISYYRVCEARPQPCIDAGSLTMYAGNILGGHNYMGYQWLSRVPVGRTVRVISGPLAGTYRVYGHLRINRQGGTIPDFPGSPALVLQTCEGRGTGFSLLHRMEG
ncbi:hypothetical protein [Streptomyces sennicomposti]